jgi:rSAM/selenodomain-associated transferase 1
VNSQEETREACLLLVVARAPEPGFTKTRLGKSIGMEAAARLHRAFLEDIANAFFATEWPVQHVSRGWAYTPEDYDFSTLIAQLSPAANQPLTVFVPQVGTHFGEKLTNLFGWATEHGFERTIIMASDSPQLLPKVVCDGFDALASHDMVIGRVVDGGYYLVGSRGFTDLLSHVPMSTSHAANALVQTATARHMTVAELPEEFDIDIAGDVALLVERLTSTPGLAPASCRMLKQLGFIVGS